MCRRLRRLHHDRLRLDPVGDACWPRHLALRRRGVGLFVRCRRAKACAGARVGFPYHLAWGCSRHRRLPAVRAGASNRGHEGRRYRDRLDHLPRRLPDCTWLRYLDVCVARTSAGRMASITYLIPVVAIVLGWALLGETPPRLAAAGGALCLAG